MYPYGIASSWNTCRKAQSNAARRWEVDDIGFVEAMIEHAVQNYASDRKRVFATGHSNGGQLSYRLLLERPDLVAGVAAVSSNLPAPSNMHCVEKKVPTPVMTINGTADPVALYNGGQRRGSTNGPSRSTDDTMKYFTELNGQDGEPEVTQLPHVDTSDTTRVERVAWTKPGNAPVILYTIHGGGHLVPQPHYQYPRVVGRMTRDLNAPEVIWEFFSKLPSRE
jgi:polyhydroxybutyrate depolymerase